MHEENNTSFNSLLASLSPDALTRGKQFERLVKWWLTQDPIWSRKIKNVWLWDEWPDYPGRDIGIDLVAEMTDGTLCAVQAKCFDENRDIPKSELDSFISAASHRTFQHRLLVATTDGLSANAKRMLADQHVVRVMRSDLESSLEVWPASIDELSAPAQPHASPRPHQNLAITDVTNGFEGHSRGQLIMACGTGKTLTALWIKETLKPKTTLVLVPSLNLLAQTLSEWAKNSLSPWQYLCVCSDDTVNKFDDQPISTVGDLPFEVTTNPADIAKFLSLGGEKIIFSTYQSSAQVAKAQEQSGVSFDLVICDEAHRLTGKTDADYATVLDEKKIVGQKRLFMTATPRTYTTAAKTKAEDRGVEITSMDDEHVYGPVLHKLSFGEAIKQDLLSDYRVLIVGVTDPQVQDLIDRRELVSVNNSVNTDARTLAAHIGLAKATKDYNLKRTISFHSRIKSADQFAKDHLKILDWLPDTHKPSGDTWTGTISGAMNTGDRRRLIKQLSLDGQDRHALLTNARCLTEGVDVPSLDGVAFIDPRSSQVDIIQAVGRAIRKSDDKEVGTIVLPVLIPTDSDTEHALQDTNFKPIWTVINSLKSHDESLIQDLENFRTELGRTGFPSSIEGRLIIDLPLSLSYAVDDFAASIALKILEGTSSRWFDRFGLFKRWIDLNGHCMIATTDLFENLPLGAWVSHQRAEHNVGRLQQSRIQLFEEIEGWDWDAFDAKWKYAFDLLVEYEKQFGHSEPPYTAKYKGFELGNWVSNQRTMRRSREYREDRANLLESLTTWSWEDRWTRSYKLLQRYCDEFGSSFVPYVYKFDRFELGVWVSNQRMAYSRNKLSEEQIKLLSTLPSWSWNPRRDDWLKRYNALLAFSEREGHCQVPMNHLEGEISLQRWMNKNRSRYSTRKNLSDEQINLLEKIPGWKWVLQEFSWDDYYAALLKFVQIHERLPSSTEKIGDMKIGMWITNQRTQQRKGKLLEDRKEKFERIPNWRWSV